MMVLIEKLCYALDVERGKKFLPGATFMGNEPGSSPAR